MGISHCDLCGGEEDVKREEEMVENAMQFAAEPFVVGSVGKMFRFRSIQARSLPQDKRSVSQ